MKNNFRFTVFTPCFNSERFIHRVIQSLEKQTFKNFEWLVINDASIDNTNKIISEYIPKSLFKITYIKLEQNQGVTANYNLAISKAQGEFLVPLGHDDEMVANALEKFDAVIKKYDSDQISAVYGLAVDKSGKMISKPYPLDFQISDYWTMFFTNKNEKEKFQCFKIEILKKYPPINTSLNRNLPAAILWGLVGCDFKAIFINEKLRIYYSDNPYSISNTSKRNSNPEAMHIYHLYWINKFQYFIHGNLIRRLRGVAAYVSYGLYFNRNIFKMLKPVIKSKDKLLVLLLSPVAIIYNLLKIKS